MASQSVVWRRATFAALASLSLLPARLSAADEFSGLAALLPRSVNAIVLLSVDKALSSPLGQHEGWRGDLDKAFRAGITRVPPQAERCILAADVDFDYLRSIGEAAVFGMRDRISLDSIAAARGAELDTIEGFRAAALDNGAYLVQFDTRTLAGLVPTNRKMATAWLRDRQAGLGISPYLQRAVRYADTTGSEIIMAIDLEGAFSLPRITAYLQRKAAESQRTIDVPAAAQTLASIKGARMGIRLAQPPSATIVVDCTAPIQVDSVTAQRALVDLVADAGLLVPEMRAWACTVNGSEAALSGSLSASGLRRVLSLAESAASPDDLTNSARSATPADTTESLIRTATHAHFKAVYAMFSDLQSDMKEAANLAVTACYFDRFAQRIERLPVLNVDPEMLDYSAEVAASLRQAASLVRNMGIRGNARQLQITSSSAGYGYAYGYRSNWYGSAAWAVPVYDAAAEARGIQMDRRKVRAEEKAAAATDIHALRSQIASATAAIRRAMSQKFQMEF